MPRGRKIGADDSNLPIGPMDEKTFRLFLRELDGLQNDVEELSEDVKSKRSELSAKWKEFKKAGGKPDAMRQVMNMRKMEDGDLIQLEEDRRRYGKWMKLPIYTQSSLFEEDEPAPKAAAADKPKREPRAAKTVDNATGSPLN